MKYNNFLPLSFCIYNQRHMYIHCKADIIQMLKGLFLFQPRVRRSIIRQSYRFDRSDCERRLIDSPSSRGLLAWLSVLQANSSQAGCKRAHYAVASKRVQPNAGGSRDRFSRPDVNLRRRLLENTPPRWIRSDRISRVRF